MIEATCLPARSFGAIPDDGLDDRAALQAALNSGCVQLETGRYDVVTPPTPRTRQVLTTSPSGDLIYGVGRATLIAFTGATNSYDWRGIQLSDGTRIHDLSLTNLDMVATTPNDQVPIMRLDGTGGTAGIEIDHIWIENPTLGGDCIQFVCYDVVTPSDRRCWEIAVHDARFGNCSRSGIALHSGVHRYSIRDNVFADSWDQDIDGEGQGISDGEIADNAFLRGPHAQSTIAVAPQNWKQLRMDHNRLDGRSLDAYGCEGCEFDHNTIIHTGAAAPALYARKNFLNVDIHHETYENSAAAAVIKIEQAGTVHPGAVRVRDSRIIQHYPTTAFASIGTVGLDLDHVEITYDGPTPRIAMDVQPSSGTSGVQTTGISVRHSTFVGPFQAILHLNGGGYGVGSFEVTNSSAATTQRSVWCENTNTAVGVQGPATYAGNSMPNATCGSMVLQ